MATASEVKELREVSGAGLMDCKNALEEAGGDMEKAVEILRVAGAAKATARGESRQTSNGIVAASGNTLIELLCETDFVAKNPQFINLAQKIADDINGGGAANTADIDELAAIMGEKIQLGSVETYTGDVTIYLHNRSSDLPPQVGVIVGFEGESEKARIAAMQVASMKPRYLNRSDVPANVIATERRVATAEATAAGKPANIIPRIVEGKVNAFFKDTVLLEQASVRDPSKTVEDALGGTTIKKFSRMSPAGG